MGLPPATGLADLGLSDSAIHIFVAALQKVLTEVLGTALPSLSMAAQTGKVATLSLLHLHFICGVAGDWYLPPIREVLARGIGRMEGLDTLNQDLMWVLTSCFRVFGGRANFSAPLPPASVRE